MSTYVANPSDKVQNEVEDVAFSSGMPTFEEGKTRVVAKAMDGAPYKTSNAGTNLRNNAGVIMPWSDRPDKFLEATIGRKV